MSFSQSSSCEESCPFNMGISCNKELSREVFFCAVHSVSLYLSSRFSRGVFWWCNARSLSLCSIPCMASLGSSTFSSMNCQISTVSLSNCLKGSSS